MPSRRSDVTHGLAVERALKHTAAFRLGDQTNRWSLKRRRQERQQEERTEDYDHHEEP